MLPTHYWYSYTSTCPKGLVACVGRTFTLLWITLRIIPPRSQIRHCFQNQLNCCEISNMSSSSSSSSSKKLLKHSSHDTNLYSADAWFVSRLGYQLAQKYFRGITQSIRTRRNRLNVSLFLVSQLQLWHRRSPVSIQSVDDRYSQVPYVVRFHVSRR